MSALERQVGGDHYKKMDIQPWQAARAWLTPEQFKGYMVGTALAYLARVNAQGDGKGGDLDIAKAMHTLEFYSESVGGLEKTQAPQEDAGKAFDDFGAFLAAMSDAQDLPPCDDTSCEACHGGDNGRVSARIVEIGPDGPRERSLEDVANDRNAPKTLRDLLKSILASKGGK